MHNKVIVCILPSRMGTVALIVICESLLIDICAFTMHE